MEVTWRWVWYLSVWK